MYTYIVIAMILLSGLTGFLIFDPSSEEPTVTESPQDLTTNRQYQNEQYGFSFEYKPGELGYVLEDDLAQRTENTDLVVGLMLTDTDEYEALQIAAEPREGPENIQILVFENSSNLSPFVWAQRHPQESNMELVLGQIEEAVVGGANAAHYIADGLYAADTYVIAHGGYIYLLIGMRNNTADEIAGDFEDIVNSFQFIKAPGQE